MTTTPDPGGSQPSERPPWETTSATRAATLALAAKEFTPHLGPMLDTVQLLSSTELTPEQKTLVRRLKTNGMALLGAINDLLDLSRIESNLIQLESMDFDLHAVVSEAVGTFENRHEAAGTAITCLIHQNVPQRVKGDPSRLKELIRRFLADAHRPGSSAETALRVRDVSGSAEAYRVQFEVADEPGAPGAEAVPPHSRRTMSETSLASALGSEILARLGRLMGAQFGMLNRPNAALRTIWFNLPLAKATEAIALPPSPRPHLRGLRALVVIGQEETRHNLTAFILSWGMACDGAPSAEAGLELMRAASARGHAYDLVLVDTALPGTTASEFVRTVAHDQQLGAARLIVVSALGMRGEMENFRQAGAAGYLSRPVDPSDLYNCVATVLSGDTPLVTTHMLKERNASLRPHVLLVEDNAVNQMVAARMLNKLGASCDVAVNGKSAVEACADTTYDLVLMDCALPEMDGFAAAVAIRTRERTTHSLPVPILAVTANAMSGDREACLAAGMNDYLAKPFTFNQFSQAVSRWIPVRIASDAPAEPVALFEPAKLDTSFLDELRNNPNDDMTEFLGRLRAQFLQEAEDRLADIGQAVERGDAEALRAAAHGLKGSSGVVGATNMASVCAELEQRAFDGEMNGVEALASDLQAEFQRVREDLEAKFSPLSPGAAA